MTPLGWSHLSSMGNTHKSSQEWPGSKKTSLPRGSGHYRIHLCPFFHVRFLLKEQWGIPEGVVGGREWDSSHSDCWLCRVKLSFQAFENSFLFCSRLNKSHRKAWQTNIDIQRFLLFKRGIFYSFNELVFAQYTQLWCWPVQLMAQIADRSHPDFQRDRIAMPTVFPDFPPGAVLAAGPAAPQRGKQCSWLRKC